MEKVSIVFKYKVKYVIIYLLLINIKNKMENIPKVPETIEEAVKALTSEHDENKAIEYLRLHPEDTQ